VGDIEGDNILMFRPKPANDDERIEIGLDDVSLAHAFNSMRVTILGLLNDKEIRTDMEACVHGAVMSIAWMAKQCGVTNEELALFLQSIEVEDLDIDGEEG